MGPLGTTLSLSHYIVNPILVNTAALFTGVVELSKVVVPK